MKEFLEHKGWISTLLGLYLAFGIITKTIIDYWIDPEFSEVHIITVSVLLAIAMFFIILPSFFKLSAGKLLVEVKD